MVRKVKVVAVLKRALTDTAETLSAFSSLLSVLHYKQTRNFLNNSFGSEGQRRRRINLVRIVWKLRRLVAREAIVTG